MIVNQGNFRYSTIPTATYKWGLFQTETTCTLWVKTRKEVRALAIDRGWRTYVYAHRVG